MSDVELEGGRTWPLAALLLPVASASLLLWWASAEGRSPHPGGAEPPVVVRPPIDVPGWFTSRTLATGGTLTARVTPLHADPNEQAFDAAALARRLAAGEGEAWRCELTYAGDAADPPLALDGLALVDCTGPVCVQLEPGPHAPPVAWMFTVPEAPLLPGEGVEVWLWGRKPSVDARLRLGPELSLALAPRTIEERELLRGLASLASDENQVTRKGLR